MAGPYSLGRGDKGHAIDPGIPGYVGVDGDGIVSINNKVNPLFAAWASEVVSYQPGNGVSASWNKTSNALGEVTGDHMDIVSLGELDLLEIESGNQPGSITLGFPVPIADGPGPDFAVFENAFTVVGANNYVFAELAYVEVSTDGNTFVRFPCVSLDTPDAVVTNVPGGTTFAIRDATTIFNLAGKHANHSSIESWGTPFNLSELSNHPLVLSGEINLSNIRFVRLVDIPGSGYFLDSAQPENPIYDAWASPSGSAGFDLEAIGVLNFSTICETIIAEGDPALCWYAATNRMYQVQHSSQPGQGSWNNHGPLRMGDNELQFTTLTNNLGTDSSFFRVVISEVP
jgi:hypothetical protein